MRVGSISNMHCHHRVHHNFKLGLDVTWSAGNRVLAGNIVEISANAAKIQVSDGTIWSVPLFNLTIVNKATAC